MMYDENGDEEPSDLDFEWDHENVRHLARHRIEPAEVEELFRNGPVIKGYDVKEGEDRWTVLGATFSVRVLVLIFTVRNEKLRVITGWDATNELRESTSRKGERSRASKKTYHSFLSK
jgi:uncharacterized DUF497 family protein